MTKKFYKIIDNGELAAEYYYTVAQNMSEALDQVRDALEPCDYVIAKELNEAQAKDLLIIDESGQEKSLFDTELGSSFCNTSL